MSGPSIKRSETVTAGPPMWQWPHNPRVAGSNPYHTSEANRLELVGLVGEEESPMPTGLGVLRLP